MLVDISWLFNKCFAHIDVSIFCNRIYNNPENRLSMGFRGLTLIILQLQKVSCQGQKQLQRQLRK